MNGGEGTVYAFLYFTCWSILLLVAETLLRAGGLDVPLLGFFFPAAAFIISPRMALGFSFLAGVSLDFVQGHMMPWNGVLLPLLTVPALFLHGKRPVSDAIEFLAGAMIPPVMAVPHIRTVLTAPDAFASLMMSCLFGAFLFPLTVALVARSAVRLKIGAAGERNGGA
jgi:hypothetical protein